MKQQYTIATNGTLLSAAHAQLLKEIILFHFPSLSICIVTSENSVVPEADFEVNSAEPATMAALDNPPHVFIQRGDSRNIALFHKNIAEKIKAGEQLVIAAGKVQQSILLKQFLQKSLPRFETNLPTINMVQVDSPPETMLQNQQYDGIIIPMYWMNDMLADKHLQQQAQLLIDERKLMVLPLFECPPVPGQGAIIASTHPGNSDAITILESCKNNEVAEVVQTEFEFANHLANTESIGAFYMNTGTTSFTYAAGSNADSETFSKWDFAIEPGLENEAMFSSTDFMKDFFSYRYMDNATDDWSTTAVFISSHKAIHSNELVDKTAQKRVWAAGTRTWYELAKKGIWVEGCADGLGMESLHEVWQSPLIHLGKKDFLIITNEASTHHWQADGWNTATTYELVPEPSATIQDAICKADLIFWTSFQQYEMYKDFVKQAARHLCPAGKTAKLLQEAGFNPVIFPTIKAFIDWRNKMCNK